MQNNQSNPRQKEHLQILVTREKGSKIFVKKNGFDVDNGTLE